MKTTQTALIVAAFVALMSGCASMSARNGEFAVSGTNMDPIHATAVAGSVTTNQYRAETDRLVTVKMLDKGMYPGYGAYGGSYGYGGGAAGDYWFHYRRRGIVPLVQQPAPPPQVIVTPGRSAPAVQDGQYATQQDLQRVEEKADDSLCMHYKAKLKAAGQPITPCPLKK